MRRVANAISEEPGEVPDNEVNPHLGNPGLLVRLESLPRYFGLLNTRVR